MNPPDYHKALYETAMNYFEDQANLRELEDALSVWTDLYEWEQIEADRKKPITKEGFYS